MNIRLNRNIQRVKIEKMFFLYQTMRFIFKRKPNVWIDLSGILVERIEVCANETARRNAYFVWENDTSNIA